MRPTHFEDNILALLTYSSTQATWTAASTLARECNVATRTVIKYLSGEYWDSFGHDYFGQIAYYYRYDYKVRTRGQTHYLSAVLRGYR